MDWIREITKSYGINPRHIDKITNCLYRIEDQQGIYALKQSNLNYNSLFNWEQAYKQADLLKLTSILPVYLNRTNKLYYEMDGRLFYLVPWVTNKPVEIGGFYRTIGKVHAQTRRKQSFFDSDKLNEFKRFNSYCKYLQEKLLSYVEKFESKEYMSPFELQVCTHYHEIQHVFSVLSTRLVKFTENYKNDTTWYMSLCHGNLMLSHILEGKQPSIINWEKAFFGNATSDLIIFFNNEIGSYNSSVQSYVTLFNLYMDENKLTDIELCLLIINLMDPTPYLTLIEDYLNQVHHKSMISLVKELQHTYRQLMFSLEFSNFIEKKYENTFEDEIED